MINLTSWPKKLFCLTLFRPHQKDNNSNINNNHKISNDNTNNNDNDNNSNNNDKNNKINNDNVIDVNKSSYIKKIVNE